MAHAVIQKKRDDPVLQKMLADAASQRYEVTELTTASGKKYSIGRPVGSAAAEARASTEIASITANREAGQPQSFHGPAFPMQTLKWKANSGGTEVTRDDWGNITSRSEINLITGIELWDVSVGGLIWKFRVYFTTSQTYTFWFRDADGDEYQCNVFVASGNHYVDYNSPKPDM